MAAVDDAQIIVSQAAKCQVVFLPYGVILGQAIPVGPKRRVLVGSTVSSTEQETENVHEPHDSTRKPRLFNLYYCIYGARATATP